MVLCIIIPYPDPVFGHGAGDTGVLSSGCVLSSKDRHGYILPKMVQNALKLVRVVITVF
jgi:hypothetical protein